MPNNKDIQVNRENRNVIGYVNTQCDITQGTQEERLRFHEVSRIYYKWTDIESHSTREGDILFVYDLRMLGSSRKIMGQRIEYLMHKGITIQLSTGNQRVIQLPDLEEQKATHLAHVRANSFFRKAQTKTASSKRGGKKPKIKQPLSDRILISYYKKQSGELSDETVKQTAERLKTDTAAYYKYLNRYLLAIAKEEVEPPQVFPESLTKKVRNLRGIVFRSGKWIDTKLKNKN